MEPLIIKSLEEFVDKANEILNNSVLSAYCYGSSVYDDFCSGYSDLDFFIVTEEEITEHTFEKFSVLRTEFKNSGHHHFSVLEGEIISKSAIKYEIESNVIYWGTSKDRLNSKYGLSGFSLRGLIDRGYLIYGEEIRKELPYPSDEEMLRQVNSLIVTIRKHAKITDENLHSMDWLFLISQSIYWLKTLDTTGKTNAAKWIINNFNYNWRDELKKAVEIRKQPKLATELINKEWLKGLGHIIQSACDTLVQERDNYGGVHNDLPMV